MSVFRLNWRPSRGRLLKVGGAAVVVIAATVGSTASWGAGGGPVNARLVNARLVAKGSNAAALTPTAQSKAQANGLIVHYVTQTPASVKAYWTPARMASAKDPMVVRPGSPSPLSSVQATGTSGSAPGWAPAGLYQGPTVQAPTPQPTGTASTQTQCTGCFIPYTRYYYFAKYRAYPTSTVGKLFFTNDGGNYVCSASVIYTNTLDTAGHCVANTDGTHQWDSNALFCPSYNAGVNAAVGCWAANYFVAWNQWINDGSFEWDFGGINTVTCGTVHCNSIAGTTGYLGVAWGQAEDQNFTAFGYPQASPFDGNYLVVCQSEFGYETSEGNNDGGPNSIAIGCDMTGGSSGGPWIIGWGSGNWVNGHNDWKWNSLPQAMNSPYVDTRDCQVWSAAGRSDITC